MKIIDTALNEVKLIEPQVFGDNRGWFYESYSYEKLKSGGIDVNFVQDNRSYSKEKGTLIMESSFGFYSFINEPQ